jgi:hypothetical protein
VTKQDALNFAIAVLSASPRMRMGDILDNDDLRIALGINEWCVNEGLAFSDDLVDIDGAEAITELKKIRQQL